MHSLVSSPDRAQDEVDAFIAELCRLRNEVRDVGQQLDRIETEVRHVLNDAVRERFEEYR